MLGSATAWEAADAGVAAAREVATRHLGLDGDAGGAFWADGQEVLTLSKSIAACWSGGLPSPIGRDRRVPRAGTSASAVWHATEAFATSVLGQAKGPQGLIQSRRRDALSVAASCVFARWTASLIL